MGVLDQFTDLAVKEFITSFIGKLNDEQKKGLKDNLKKLDEYKSKFIGNDDLYGIALVKGEVNILIMKKQDVEFKKKPTFINAEDLIKTIEEDI